MTKRQAHCIGGTILLLMLLAGREAFAIVPPLGTVFYSPAEREALVASRIPKPEVKAAEQAKNVPVKVVPKTKPYAVSGIVSRSGGKSVVWLNGKPVAETPPDPQRPSLLLSTDHAIIDGKSVKVGETVDVLSGKHVSPLPEGAVKVDGK